MGTNRFPMDELNSLSDGIARSRRDTATKEQQLYWQLLGDAADGNVDAIIEAITNGADVNFHDQSSQLGASALMIAASGGHGEAVDILLLYGADKSRKNQFGQSACDLAQENGFDDIAERLQFEENFGKELDPTAKLPTQVEKAPTAVPQVKASSASQATAQAATAALRRNCCPYSPVAAALQSLVQGDKCAAMQAENTQMEHNLNSLSQQLQEAQHKLQEAQKRQAQVQQELANSQAQQKEAEERSDKAAEVALDMQEELDSITQSSEALQEEQLKLEAQNDQLLAQRA